MRKGQGEWCECERSARVSNEKRQRRSLDALAPGPSLTYSPCLLRPLSQLPDSTRNNVQGGVRPSTVNSHSCALWVIFLQAHDNMRRGAAACVGKGHKRQTRLVRLP